jgi:hypothetical protein
MDYLIKVEGRTFTLSFSSQDIISMKEKIQAQEGIPVDQQILVYKGRRLEDGRSLEDYNIQAGATIHIILRLRGGMFHASSGRSGSIPSH